MTAPETRIPELVSGIDIRALPLSALDGFVLSRVDGRAQVREIVSVTGLPAAQVVDILERLRGLRVVRWKGEPEPVVTREQSPKARPAPSSPATQPSGRKAAQVFDTPSAYDPKELEEECDLPLDRRKQVLDLYYRLSELDYYEALEIPYDADKKQIRAAYFALSKALHPDTMFRKNLGSFKAKMEVVFNALTEGYETLGKKKSREEYDAYLRATKATKMGERALAMAKRESEENARALEVELPPPPLVPEVIEPSISSIPPSLPGALTREATPEARRLAQEVVARRLRGVIPPGAGNRPQQVGSAPPQITTSKPAPPAPAAGRTDPRELLRRLARTLKDVGEVTGTNDQVALTVKASEAAFARGDLGEATQLMRKAVSLAPKRLDLQAEHDRLSKQLAEKLASDYAVQAQFETKHGKWASAALAWSKVCEGRPTDADAHRLAAVCLFKVGGDLRGAQKYAQQATFLAPDDFDARVLLAQIYLTLGLKLNAKRELDAAAKLDPDNEMVKNLLSDLKS